MIMIMIMMMMMMMIDDYHQLGTEAFMKVMMRTCQHVGVLIKPGDCFKKKSPCALTCYMGKAAPFVHQCDSVFNEHKQATLLHDLQRTNATHTCMQGSSNFKFQDNLTKRTGALRTPFSCI